MCLYLTYPCYILGLSCKGAVHFSLNQPLFGTADFRNEWIPYGQFITGCSILNVKYKNLTWIVNLYRVHVINGIIAKYSILRNSRFSVFNWFYPFITTKFWHTVKTLFVIRGTEEQIDTLLLNFLSKTLFVSFTDNL